MGNRGPNKTPTTLKILNGNPGKRPLPQNEPKPTPIAPARPAWLTGDGRKIWDRLSPQLEKLGLLTSIDGEAFAAACQCWGTYVKTQRYIKSNGFTYEHINKAGEVNTTTRPEVYIGQKALDQFKSFCAEFGLTPASRASIDIKPDKDEMDPMEALMSK